MNPHIVESGCDICINVQRFPQAIVGILLRMRRTSFLTLIGLGFLTCLGLGVSPLLTLLLVNLSQSNFANRLQNVILNTKKIGKKLMTSLY